LLSLDLARSIEMALGKNFSIEVQRFDPKIARERVRSTMGRFDPQLDLSVNRGEATTRSQFIRNPETNAGERLPFRNVTQSGNWSAGVSGVTVWGLGYDVGAVTRKVGDDYESEVAFSLNQPLLRGAGLDANLANVRIAKNNVLASEWTVRDRVMQVITDVIAVYNDLHFALENHEVAKRSQGLARQLLQDNIKRVEIGVMKPLDVTQAQAEVAAREEAVLTAARAVKDQENFLKQLITADLLPLLGKRISIVIPPVPKFRDNVLEGVAQALEWRPDYQQAKLNLANRNINLAFEKNNALPRLDLTASLALNGFDNDFGTSINRIGSRDQSSWNVGAIFSFPLGNREATGRVNAERLGIAQALVDLKRLEQSIIVEIDNARGAVITARARIEANEESERLARAAVDAGQKELIAGISAVFEVLQLQDNAATAESATLRAKADFNKAVARYHQFTGTTLKIHGVTLQ
jgi:outer membrane protein